MGRSQKKGGAKKGGAGGGGGAVNKGKTGGGGSKKGTSRFGGGNTSGQRGQARKEARLAARGKQKKRTAQGGAEAVAATRIRLKLKALQKQLARFSPNTPAAERSAIVLETAELHAEAGHFRQAIKDYEEVLQLEPSDPHFKVRTPLLCLLMDEGHGAEAKQLIEGSLFQSLVSPPAANPARPVDCPAAEKDTAVRLAILCGAYSHALLGYISLHVMQEEADPRVAAANELKLVERLQRAHQANPFVAELIAFAPAFDNYFEPGADIPPASACGPMDGPLLDALQYLIVLRQLNVWLDTDEEVRSFVRCTLFEKEVEEGADEEPPLTPLPVSEGVQESGLLLRWRRAREEAMELWAEEMSVESGDGGDDEVMEGCEHGESEEGLESSMGSEACSEDFAGREERSGAG